MTKGVLSIAALLLFQTPAIFGQGRPVEVFVGYANHQSEGLPNRNDPNGVFDTDFFRDRTTQHGVNASVTGVIANAFSLTGDFSWGRNNRSDETSAQRDSRHTDTYYLLAGPGVKFARGTDPRLEPFVRVMAGAAHTRFEASRVIPIGGGTQTRSFEVGATDFAAAAGGGLDVRLSENVKLRVIQFDYTPVFLRDRTIDILGDNGVIQPARLDSQRQDNFRFSFGIVF